MKAPKPFYNINHEKNLLQHSVKEIYDQFGGQRNYQDDRYTSNLDSLSRDRRDLSYGNPCHPPRAACAALHSYTGRSALSAEPCWKPLNYVCQKVQEETFVQYQSVWEGGAVANLHLPTGKNKITMEFPVPVKLNVWHGTRVTPDEFSTRHTVEQRVHGNNYEKHSGNGLLAFELKAQDGKVIPP